jgi:hypothetical protein
MIRDENEDAKLLTGSQPAVELKTTSKHAALFPGGGWMCSVHLDLRPPIEPLTGYYVSECSGILINEGV